MNSESGNSIENLQHALAENPKSMRFARLADAYLQAGNIHEAIEVCLQGIENFPRYVTGHYILAKCYLSANDLEKARKEFEKVLEIDPKHVLAWKCYGDLLHNLGKSEASEMSYSEVVTLDPLDEDARAQLEVLRKNREADWDDEVIDDISKTAEPGETLETGDEGPGIPTTSSEEKFSYILDDIFSEDEAEADGEAEPEDVLDIAGIIPPEAIEPPDEEFTIETTPPETPVREPEPLDVIEQPVEAPESQLPPEPDQVEAEPEAEEEQPEHLIVPQEDEDVIDEQIVQEEPAPVPAPAPAEEPEPPKEEESKEEASKEKDERIVTPTLGEIYAAQGQFAKAIGVFEILARKDPDNEAYKQKIEFLRQRLEEEGERE